MSMSLSEIAGQQTARDRRLIMKAVDYWESIQGAYAYPRMIDFDIDAVPDMAGQSFLIDINLRNVQMSQIRYVGDVLAQDCSRDVIGKPVTSVPRGSLISRLTDHFMQILANKAPMSFEAEYTDAAGMATRYRGIMMPLSDNGQEIDYILGVINCRSESAKRRDPLPMGLADASPPEQSAGAPAVIAEFPRHKETAAEAPIDAVCEMMEELRECRGAAYMVQDARDRLADREFRMLEKTFGLLHTARENPLTFTGLLEDCGQPFDDRDLVATIVKLVFGGDYAQEDVTLYTTALRRALRDGQTPGTIMAYLQGLEGGLKDLVREEPIPLDMEGLLRPR